jgi:hypothetical protein
LTPGPAPWGRNENNVALAPNYHMGKLYTEFGEIPPSGLGGDTITDGQTDGRTDERTDRQTDGGDYNIPDAFFQKAWGLKSKDEATITRTKNGERPTARRGVSGCK